MVRCTFRGDDDSRKQLFILTKTEPLVGRNDEAVGDRDWSGRGFPRKSVPRQDGTALALSGGMEKQDLVVIGNGMVGHRFLELLLQSGKQDAWNIVTFCEEPRLAYDRVNLSGFFAGKTAGDLSLVTPRLYEEAGITVHVGDRAASIDRARKMVISARGVTVQYHKLVLATGSSPLVPPVAGAKTPGCFVYRTVEDLEAIRAWAAKSRTGVVIGGGLLVWRPPTR
jgi:NAD(P)H-nitrite reductase large subunit